MKETQLFKEIFRLAVRLAGLFFFCIGLKDLVVQTFMALAQAHGPNVINVVTNFLPVGFTLTVAFWLLKGTWLIRLAYPESARSARDAAPLAPSAPAEPKPERPGELSEKELAEQKLAALVKQGSSQ